MRYEPLAVGMMAHAIVYLYRNKDNRASRLIYILARRQGYQPQVVLEWITKQAVMFSKNPMAALYDSDDIEEFISRCQKAEIRNLYG